MSAYFFAPLPDFEMCLAVKAAKFAKAQEKLRAESERRRRGKCPLINISAYVH